MSLSGSSFKVFGWGSPSKVADLLKLIRPHQWIKNGFVFVPFVFAGELTNLALLRDGLVVFAAFCLASSGVYVLNDLVDAEADRAHPRKAQRPIASGRVGSAEAVLAMAALSAGGIGGGYLVSLPVGNMLLSYVGLSVLYSFYTKHQVLLDVFSIAGGFLLRVMAGAYASTVAPSHWILLMTLFLSLMLGLGKRRGELLELARGSENHRTVLNAYSVATIDQMLVVLVGMVVVTFSVYTGSEYATRRFGTNALVYTVPLVVYGLFRYLYVMNDKGGSGDPTEILLSDRPLLLCVAGWILACAWIIYR
ncbi:MAG: decaprenyl-phosphate phosphoribosyltransferase [Acidobacteria bacterium]|nr:decaprenyl-phosphate phosphoribosyltransferase [Acidobacteriota bacterium]